MVLKMGTHHTATEKSCLANPRRRGVCPALKSGALKWKLQSEILQPIFQDIITTQTSKMEQIYQQAVELLIGGLFCTCGDS